MTQINLSEEILKWILATTNYDLLIEKTTKQVAEKFNLTTNEAYKLCSNLADKGLITKLDPVNDNMFSCCGWIMNDDDDNRY